MNITVNAIDEFYTSSSHSGSDTNDSVTVDNLSVTPSHRLTESALLIHAQRYTVLNPSISTDVDNMQYKQSINTQQLLVDRTEQSYANTFEIDGYENYEVIFDNRHTLVYKAIRVSDGVVVAIKTPNSGMIHISIL